MRGMFDARCPRCKKHIGWRGSVMDRPPCPRCGHRPADEVLRKDQEELAQGIEELQRLADQEES